MKVVSLTVCGALALPALAQEKPTPEPEVGAKAEKPAEREAAREMAARELLALRDFMGFQLQRMKDGEEVDLRGWRVVAAQLPEDRHVAEVPDADQALLDIQKAAQKGRSAKDLDAILEALDEIEKAVMRARTSLHEGAEARDAAQPGAREFVLPVDPADQAVLEKVRGTTVGRLVLTEESGSYRDLVGYLQIISGAPMAITPKARDVIDSERLRMVVEFVHPISAAEILDEMVGKSEKLAWTVRHGVVQITTKREKEK